MKRFFPIVLALFAFVLPSRSEPSASASAEEEQLIATLKSNRSPAEKDAACARLKWIGTTRCVPALAVLLTSDDLSHSARFALESMPGEEAEKALLQALGKVSGSNQIGILNSLAVRHDPAAVPALERHLSTADTNLACAAAMGLGRIGGPRALKALEGAWSDSAAGAVHSAEIDGLLACANQLLTDHKDRAALKVFQRLYDSAKTEGIRQAAFRGVILASGKRGIPIMAAAIAGNDAAIQGAALQMATKLEGPEATKALADLMPNGSVPVQIALLECLQRRADSSALPAVAKMLGSSDPDVRMAAINAMGDLGDGSVALVLAKQAASASGPEKIASREALLNLRRGQVTPVLLEAFATAPPEVKPELIRALGGRGDTSAAPKLLEWARSQDDAMRSSSLQALALLSGPAQVADLVQLTVKADSDAARSEAADALNSTCQRIESRSGHLDAGALVEAVKTGPLEARLVLLPVCSGLTEATVRDALRATLADAEPRICDAALRALCDTRDGELLPDLLKAASGAGDDKLRLLAVRGCVRLATQEEGVKLSNDQKLAALKNLLDMQLEVSEKRLILSGLGTLADSQALDLAGNLLGDATVKPEATEAVIQIAGSLAATHPEQAGEALKKVVAVTTDPAALASAQDVQKKIWQTSGYVTVWQVAGPFEQQGRIFSELFDIPFPPESADASTVHWRKLPVNAAGAESWKMDLLQAIGGVQRVAYARTWINSPKKQSVRLEIGSDDGVKVWLNNRIVHANNASRPLQAGADKVDVTLNRGWNSLLLKVTQNTSGWGFCVRVAEANGEPIPGVRASLNPPVTAKR